MNVRTLVAAVAAIVIGTGAEAQSLGPAEFAALPAMESPSLSPDGQRIAFITFTESDSAVLIANLADMTITHTITSAAGKPRGLTWSSDDSLVFFTSGATSLPGMRGRFENVVPVGVDLSTPGRVVVNQLLQEQRRTERGGGGRTQQVGGYIFLQGAQLIGYERSTGRILMPKFNRDAQRTLYLVDPKNDRQREVDEGLTNTFDWVVDENGEPLFRAEFRDRANYFTILERTSGRWNVMVQETTEIPELDLYGLNDARELIVGTRPADVGRYGLYVMDVANGQIGRPVLADAIRDVDSVEIDPYTNRVVGASIVGAATTWFDADLAMQQQLLDEAFPGESPYIVTWSQDRTKFIVHTETSDRPPSYYIYDAAALSADVLAPAYPRLVNAALPSRELYSYAARDGVQVPAYLTRPRNAAGPAPLVLLPHGGPEACDVGGFDWIAHFLANRGYVVLQPNFRGSGCYGSNWLNAGRGQWGTGVMQNDVTDGIAALAAEGIADPNRVCIVGGSYGGYAALAGAAFTPELYRCAAAIAPVTDLAEFIDFERDRFGTSSMGVSYWQAVIGGDLGAARSRLNEMSPLQHAASVQAPVLLIHGRDDSVVPIAQSRDMENALRRAGKTVELIELRGEDHYLSRPETRLETLQALDRFLAEHLGG
jgi:dipeptidyl aminopeptidase/acylaminoacyl peptidase